MKVAVCDDLTVVLDDIKEKLEQLEFVEAVQTFSKIELFFDSMHAGNVYDVVLMDLDWNQEKTGMDFAAALREASPKTKIIYITAHTAEFVEDIFLQPSNLSGFLMKPVKLEQLRKNLEKVYYQKRDTEGKLAIRQKGSVVMLPFQNIIYMENQLHKVKIVMDDKEYVCNERLEQLKERLGGQFLNCHKSYVVNMEKIVEFKSSLVVLTNGRSVPISKARSGEAKKTFFAYISEKM